MGNSPSNSNQRPPPAPPPRSRPLKNKKRSIVDHPALLTVPIPDATATSRTQAPSSSPIPIPSQPGLPTPLRPPPPPPNDSFSTDYVADLLQRDEHSTHRPIQYNSTRSFGAVRRGGVQGGGWTNDVSAPATTSSSPTPAAFMPEIVRSSIPLRITQAESSSRGRRDARLSGGDPDEDARADDAHDSDKEDDLLPTTVLWRGGGKEVFLAGTFDALEWRARERMRFEPSVSSHTITLYLPPGTYRIKFIVDDSWRCSDDMPTAVDDETGNLVNYVDVEDPSALDSAAASGGEERQGRDGRVMKANRRRTYPARKPTSRPRYHPPQLPPSASAFWGDLDTDTELETVGWGRGRDGVLEKWSNEIPAPLTAAAQQEEAYIAAVQAQRDVRRGGAGVGGTVPSLGLGVPSVPPAPRLPRHLEKVLLNTRQSSSHAASGSGASAARKHRGSSRSRVGMTSLLSPDAAVERRRAESTRSSTAAMEQWAQADDSSVLPVPNHVVLHHLGTSAIKNGVLAVSDTVRYNKKYITTIYYKPT